MANRIVTMLVNENGEVMGKLNEYQLQEVLNKNGVIFFNGIYEAPHDIWDLVDNEMLTVSQANKFLQLIRRKNLNKENLVIVRKRAGQTAADLLEMGEIMGLKADSTSFRKETQRLISLFKRLQLIAESYNDKLDRVEYYINPCFHKPASRLSVELYGLFVDYLFKAMTVHEVTIGQKAKNIKEGDLKTNTYRNAIHQAYLSQRSTTSNDKNAEEFLREEKIEVIERNLNDVYTPIKHYEIEDVIEQVNRPTELSPVQEIVNILNSFKIKCFFLSNEMKFTEDEMNDIKIMASDIILKYSMDKKPIDEDLPILVEASKGQINFPYIPNCY